MKHQKPYSKAKQWTRWLAAWHHPSQSIVKRTIALLIAVSFLFPTISWAFDVENYLYESIQGIQLGSEGSRSLALDYTIPSSLGKVVEADYQPGKQTFVLLQDLHCHYEVQKNIADILDILTTRHDDLNLVAVEGGSGIIPALELAAIPESPAKRAVSDYFMKQGKLTGADYLVINDRTDLELYGAEDSGLYNNSLVLIRKFTTEENRGLVIEIMDQLAFLQEKVYNPALLAFENRRKYYLKSDADGEAYLRALVREAKKSGIDSLPAELMDLSARRELNYHEKVVQQAYLEKVLQEKLFMTAAERRLSQYQSVMELAERIINVSASREDLAVFQTLTKSTPLKSITDDLNKNLGDTYFNLTEASDRLGVALQQALRFYEFADQRDRALYRNALQRTQDRREKKVVLISGGYHTSAIQAQIKRDGYGYVTIQPAMSKAEAGTQYFELLRYPGQQTTFEKIIANQTMQPRAMAVRNFLTLQNFRTQFGRAVDFVNLSITRMRDSNLVRLPGMTLERIRGKLVKITSVDGLNIMGLLFNRQGVEILDKNGVNQYTADPTLLGSTQVRAISLAMLGTGVLAATILPLMGVATALSPALTLMGMSVILIAGWWLATQATGDFMARVFNKRNVILAFMAIGVFALPVISQVILSDVTTAVASGTVGPVSALQSLLDSVRGTFGFFPGLAAMTPLAHTPLQAMSTVFGTMQLMGSMAMTPILSGLRYSALMNKREIRDKKNSAEVLQSDFSDLAAEEARQIMRRMDQERHGYKYEKGQARPAEGAFEIVPEENAAVMLDALVQNGLVRFEDNTPVDFSVKDFKILAGDYIEKVPTSSEILFQFPKREGGSAHVLFRVMLIDPRFVDENGKPVHREIPQAYVQAVLNNLNPLKLFLAYGKEMPELLKRAGDQGPAFEQLIKFVAKKWKDRQAPGDFETLREVVTLGMLHEFTHALALHLPDQIPADASEETRRDLEPITFDKYLTLINSDQSLQTSVAFTKNLFKALREVAKNQPSNETRSRINEVLALEMFCDRFSMFLYENYAKMRIYTENFKAADIPFSVDVDFMLRMETQRRAGTLRQMRGLENVLNDAEFDKLEKELADAEQSHFFVAKYGDPQLTEQELEFFTRFLNLVKYFDGEKQIMRFTMDHANKSRFMQASVTELTREMGLGIDDVVETATDMGELASGVWNVMNQREEGRMVIEDTEKMDIQEAEAPQQMSELEDAAPPLLNLSAQPAAKDISIVDRVDFINEAAMGVTDQTSVEGSEGEAGETGKKKDTEEDQNAMDLLASLDEAAPLTTMVLQADDSTEITKERTAEGKQARVVRDAKQEEQDFGSAGAVIIDSSGESMPSENNYAANVVAPESNPDLGLFASAAGMAAGKSAVPSSFTSPNAMPYFAGADAFTGNNLAGDLTAAQANQAVPGMGTGVNSTGMDAMDMNAQLNAAAQMNAANNGLRAAVPGEFNAGIPSQAAMGKTASDWQAIPSRDMPGQNKGSDFNPLGAFNAANPELVRSLGLPKDVQDLILGDQRITYLVGKATEILPMLPASQPITFGFDSQSLADQFNSVLNSMQGTPQGAVLAGRIQSIVFPQDSATGMRNTPTNWQAANGIAVLSDQMSNLRPVTVVLNADGNAAVAVPLLGIKKDKISEDSLKSIPGWDKILNAHNATMGQMRNQEELNDYYLVTAATIADLQQAQQGLLSNLLTPVTGFQDVSNLTVKLPTAALKAAARPAFDAGAQRVVLDINLAGLESLMRASASDTLGIAMFGSNALITSSLEYNINSAFIQALLAADTLEAAPLDMVVDQDALETEYGVNRQGKMNQWLESLKSRIAELMGEQAADRMDEDEARAQADELMGLDSVTLISRSKRLGEHLMRERGRAWEQPASLFSTDVYYAFKHGRMQSKPVMDIDAWNPKVEATKHSRQRGLSKIFSALLLGFAAGVLVFDAFVEIARTRDAKGKRLSVFAVLRHPNFTKALQLMSMVVMGNAKAMDYLSPAVRQQISDLQKLSAVDDDKDVVKLQEQEAVIDTLQGEQIPVSLKYSMGQFRTFKKMLMNHPVFKFLMRITGVRNILPLYPELFVILSESRNMQAVMWYFAPAVTTRKNLASLDNTHPALAENVLRSPETARQELADLKQQLQQLQAAAQPDIRAMNAIDTQIRDRRFTLLLNRTLDTLGQTNNNRNVRKLIRVLLKELARRDVDNPEAYQEDILKILSMLEPFQQVPVQIVLESGKKVQASIPASLNDTMLRDQMLFFLDVYDAEGRPMLPLRRKVLRAGASA